MGFACVETILDGYTRAKDADASSAAVAQAKCESRYGEEVASDAGGGSGEGVGEATQRPKTMTYTAMVLGSRGSK